MQRHLPLGNRRSMFFSVIATGANVTLPIFEAISIYCITH
jgi:hypothetical protein